MGRLLILVSVFLILIGALVSFEVPMDWVGHLPGDFSFEWREMRVFVPITTSIIFSLILSIFLFMFSKR